MTFEAMSCHKDHPLSGTIAYHQFQNGKMNSAYYDTYTPNHCKNALQIIPLGRSSMLFNIVEPVVVTPLIDSNKASTMSNQLLYKQMGPHRKVISNQDKTVIMKASLN